MATDFTLNSCREFVEVLASNAPVPGGGGAAALVGAIGTALGNYPAANLGTAPSAFMDLVNTVQAWGAYDRTGENTPDRNTEAGLMKAYLTERCGVEAAGIYIDEEAMTTQENAVNTFRILQEKGVKTMTIVTSSYHQRWGQTVYHTVAELYRRRHGYSVEIVGNSSLDREPDVPMYAMDARIAAFQIAGILELPDEVRATLPSFFPSGGLRSD